MWRDEIDRGPASAEECAAGHNSRKNHAEISGVLPRNKSENHSMATADKIFREPVSDASMEDYEHLFADRPYKFDQQASNYHRATAQEPRCDSCMHFFQRKLDGHTVCEVVRPVPEEVIYPEFTCKFQTADGMKFPLYKD